MGQHVVFRTSDGIHHGILQSMTNEGILVRPMGAGSTRLANSTTMGEEIDLLQNASGVPEDISEAWFPFLFFPFFALWWLWPWAWWW